MEGLASLSPEDERIWESMASEFYPWAMRLRAESLPPKRPERILYTEEEAQRMRRYVIKGVRSGSAEAAQRRGPVPSEIIIAGDRYRNLTGHSITLLHSDGSVKARVSPADADPVRVDLQKTRINEVLFKSSAVRVLGLPPEEPGVYLIVSALVKLNSPGRDDLVVPTLVTKDYGRVVGCQGFLM